MSSRSVSIAVHVLTLIGAIVFANVVAGEHVYPVDLAKRAFWTTSKVIGTPDPPFPYTLEKAFGLRFENPLDIQPMPGSKRLFVSEQYGQIYSFENDPNTDRKDPFLNIQLGSDPKKVPWNERRQIWSITFHPEFEKNGFVYVCYADPVPKPLRNRISRFKIDPKVVPPVADKSTETIIFEWPNGVDHFGGCLRFGPDGCLYFTAGDGNAYADGDLTGQDISDICASVMRINVNNTLPGRYYSIPPDNPFVNTPGARAEIWAYGTRNIWRMSFDRLTGELWGADVGQDLWEPIYRIEKGGNYGWSVMEGSNEFRAERKRGPTPILKPVYEIDHSQARSITGGFVYRGTKYKDLVGEYVFGDYDTGKIWGLRYDGVKATVRELVLSPRRIVSFGEDLDGELFIVDYVGHIYKMVPTPPVDPSKPIPPFPRKLSETGLFASTKDHQPAAGVVPYSVNSPLWSDHAKKERFFAIPGDGKMGYSKNGAYGFPEGSVMVKTFALEMEAGNPASTRRLETRLLHFQYGNWRGYTYIWNDEQTDAVLLEEKTGLDRKFSVRDAKAPGGVREQTWHFPSRSECTLCHTMPMGFVLGASTAQMNREHDFGNGIKLNQLDAYEKMGLFSNPPSKTHARAEWPRLPDPADEKEQLEVRARSYLHGNCAHCHTRWGGGNSAFNVPFKMPLEETGIVNGPVTHGDMGIAGARLLVPGHPEKSMLLERMKTLGPQRMPRAATTVVDEAAVDLIRAWITGMK